MVYDTPNVLERVSEETIEAKYLVYPLVVAYHKIAIGVLPQKELTPDRIEALSTVLQALVEEPSERGEVKVSKALVGRVVEQLKQQPRNWEGYGVSYYSIRLRSLRVEVKDYEAFCRDLRTLISRLSRTTSKLYLLKGVPDAKLASETVSAVKRVLESEGIDYRDAIRDVERYFAPFCGPAAAQGYEVAVVTQDHGFISALKALKSLGKSICEVKVFTITLDDLKNPQKLERLLGPWHATSP